MREYEAIASRKTKEKSEGKVVFRICQLMVMDERPFSHFIKAETYTLPGPK